MRRLPVMLALLAACPVASAPKLKPNGHPLVGRWAAVKVIGYDKDESATNKDLTYTFTADGRWIIRDGEGKGGYVVKGSAIDLRTDAGRVIPGIHDLSEDTLTLCLAEVGDPRPTELTAGPRLTYLEMKRAK
jgi:uncharacterized protein (TIGR03067 family)